MNDEEPRADESMHEALARCRAELERIDRAIVGMLGERLQRGRKIGRLKRAMSLPAQDTAREAEVIRYAAESAREHGVPEDAVRDIFWQIIALSREVQADANRG